jgi:hypothetical protein
MGWLGELLLESVAPPSSYLPSRREKLRMAGRVLRGGSETRQEVTTATLQDLAPIQPFGRPRVVSAQSIADELEEDLRTINPPVVQGWMALLLGIALIASVYSLGWVMEVRDVDGRLLRGIVLVLPEVAWLLVVTLACARMRELELDGDRIRLRRWLDYHLHRPGADLGPADDVGPELDGSTVRLFMPAGETRISMLGWPPSARVDAAEELPIWCGLDPAGRESRRAERDRRREAARERRRMEEEARRRGG